MQPRACSLGALMESETHTRILQGDTLRQTVDAESHKPAQTPLWCARHAWAHSETVSDTHLNTCAHVRAHMHTHARTHTHLPQASGTALCQVSWEGDRLQPAVAGRCPENNAPPPPPPAQTQGAIVSLAFATGQPLNRLSWRLCLCAGEGGWQLPRPTCSHPPTPGPFPLQSLLPGPADPEGLTPPGPPSLLNPS